MLSTRQELEKRKQDVAVRMASEHALEELLNYKPTLSDVDTMTGLCQCLFIKTLHRSLCRESRDISNMSR